MNTYKNNEIENYDAESSGLSYDEKKTENKFKYDYIADWINVDDIDDDDFIDLIASNEEQPTSTSKSKENAGKSKASSKNKTSKASTLHKGHRERVRNKFMQYGLDSFTKYEVLELLLFYSIPLKDTNEIAHRLLDKFGSVKAVINADTDDLMEVDGINEVSASLISFHRELYKYIHTKEFEYETLATSAKAGKFCCEYFKSHINETFIVICLDLNSVVKNIEVISEGCENETAMYPRKTIKKILQNKCSKVIIAHNHPGEHPEPSTEDVVITGQLNGFLESVGIFLMDHIICSGNQYVSLSDRGLMDSKKDR